MCYEQTDIDKALDEGFSLFEDKEDVGRIRPLPLAELQVLIVDLP